MNKAISIVVIVGILMALGLAFFFVSLFKSNPPASIPLPLSNTINSTTDADTTDEPPATLSVSTAPATSAQLNPSNTIAIRTLAGGSISANNLVNDPLTAKDPINAGYYYLGYHVSEGVPDPTATANPPFVIEYIATTQYFNISLLQEPIGENRTQAEQLLMTHLGISESDMCQLDYMVAVPSSVNQIYAGQNLGFSFCPGAVDLPQ